MCWHRPSGALASLPCTAPTNGALYGLRSNVLVMLHTAAPVVPPSQPAAPAVQAPEVTLPRVVLCPSVCGSPRALGDVPMLLSEQQLWGSADGSATFSKGERRTRGSSAGKDALESSASAEAAADDSPDAHHHRKKSFGADSKYGFEDGAFLFSMDWESMSDSDDDDEAFD